MVGLASRHPRLLFTTAATLVIQELGQTSFGLFVAGRVGKLLILAVGWIVAVLTSVLLARAAIAILGLVVEEAVGATTSEEARDCPTADEGAAL